MNTSLIINSTDSNGKAYQKSISNINPEKANATLGEFAQMLNGLSTNTYVNASRVDKSDVTEEGGGSGGSGKTEGVISLTITGDNNYRTYSIDYNGDGELFIAMGQGAPYGATLTGHTLEVSNSGSSTASTVASYVCARDTDNYTAAIAAFYQGVK